jgi:hypothetical protein
VSYLQSATPSFRPANRSPLGRGSPREDSMNVLTSLAADSVYLSKRNLRISLSREVTEAMIAINLV